MEANLVQPEQIEQVILLERARILRLCNAVEIHSWLSNRSVRDLKDTAWVGHHPLAACRNIHLLEMCTLLLLANPHAHHGKAHYFNRLLEGRIVAHVELGCYRA
jgi:hypothetical protein